ncbi:MAG: molybdopterin synthase catalytic subunit MoaE [Candidatus Puniceispirillum sp.]
MVVRITEDDFDIAAEHQKLKSVTAGAIVTFTGTVRDLADGGLQAMTLEHYPGMTESEIEAIVATAQTRWPLTAVSVIHRIGRLQPSDNIVFVGCASAHRGAAFDAANFIMDYLKTNAPFWKKEDGPDGAQWVDARDSDTAALGRWQRS